MIPPRVIGSLLLPIVVTGLLTFAQTPPTTPPEPEAAPDVRLPNGRSQRNEIAKADHAKNLDDARELVKLSEELKADLEKNNQYILSIADFKKTEEIEKVARRIRSRMKRF